MADAVVSVVAERMIALLEEQATYHINLVRGAEKEVRNLAKELKTVRNVLDDAERRGYKETSIKDWLLRLERTSYEMEDVLDEWDYAILKLRMEGGDRSGGDAAPREKVTSFIPSFSCLCCKKVAIRHGIAKKIIDVKEKLDEVLKEKHRYSFDKSEPAADVPHKSRRDPSTSFADLEVVRGRDSDRDILVTKLMGRKEELGIQVVSIVGVGGLGKTTLAQLVYNDTRVEKEFPLRIWICVSDPFDLAAIAKGFLEGVSRESSPNTTELDVLLKDVKESISKKKFLLVLDDVWTQDAKVWEPLKASLRFGGKGSKVLVTTRDERVAISMGTTKNDIYHPQLLSHEDCWSLLCRISLSGRSEEECEIFHDIGKKIASKCEGLPLAACVLGSLLQFKYSLDEWESVFESEIWKLEEAEVQLFPHLLLSYNQLSPPLKRCFSYCAVFPKDFKIDVGKLIENWIAQGYLGSNVGNVGDMELRGQEYFQNLAMRSLFQELERGESDERIMSCKMHDIVHDFAQSLRKDRSCVGVEAEMKMATCHRCSSSLVSNVKSYRSILSYDQSYICDCLTSLRVLSIAHFCLDRIPWEIEKLIHLRWLDLSWTTPSREDVKIICKLYNLQFLRLKYCDLEEIPSDIGNLTQLRHLILKNNSSLKELPKEIGNLIRLKHLDLSYNSSLEELPKEIKSLIQLRHLNLKWVDSLKGIPKEIGNLIELRHLDLSYIKSLKELPEEIGKLIQLRHLDLSGNRSLMELPKGIGDLIKLRHLDLSYNHSRKELPEEIANLIQLRHLDLRDNRSLEKLPEKIGNLIQLRHLNLNNAVHLRELPKSFYELINLRHFFNWCIKEKLFSEGLSKLTNLSILTVFTVGKGCGKLGWLKNLNLLSGSLVLYIKWIDDAKDMVEDAREADLRNKKHLRELAMWFQNEETEEDEMDEENDSAWKNVMDSLELHPDLKILNIHFYEGSKLAGWISSPLFQLRSIMLWRFHRLQSLPPLGKLPCLEKIEIVGMTALQFVGREFLGITGDIGVHSSSVGFPKLKKLTVRDCGSWREWWDITVEEERSASVTLMPSLTELLIEKCNCLKALPERLLNKKAVSLEYVEIDYYSCGDLINRYKDRDGAILESRSLKVPFGPKYGHLQSN